MKNTIIFLFSVAIFLDAQLLIRTAYYVVAKKSEPKASSCSEIFASYILFAAGALWSLSAYGITYHIDWHSIAFQIKGRHMIYVFYALAILNFIVMTLLLGWLYGKFETDESI